MLKMTLGKYDNFYIWGKLLVFFKFSRDRGPPFKTHQNIGIFFLRLLFSAYS